MHYFDSYQVDEATTINTDYLPMSYLTTRKIGNIVVPQQSFTCLFDTGSKSSWIKPSILPKGITAATVPSIDGVTMAGIFRSDKAVTLHTVQFPEFNRARTIDGFTARVMEHENCRYDLILGRDVLRLLGLQTDFAHHVMTWDDNSVPMKNGYSLSDRDRYLQQLSAHTHADTHEEEETHDEILQLHHECVLHQSQIQEGTPEELGYKSKIMTSSEYNDTRIEDVVAKCTHLSKQQQDDLYGVLRKYDKLFDGKLKAYTDEKITLDIDPTVKPTQVRPYSVPILHRKVFKEELDRLVEAGVLEPSKRSEWISGTFCIPKKDGKVRWISDFRGLNKAIKRKVYHLPRIKDILQRRKGYKFLSKIDLSMCYYTYELDDDSKELTTIATPFGLYRYRRLPMGVSIGPDVAQEIIENLFKEIEDIEAYIDDVACFSQDWKAHLIKLDNVLTLLQQKGFTVNPAKCEWCVQETDFLGHWLTPHGVKPWKKKIDALLRMERPQNRTQVKSFLGLVQYYRDMWPKRSHILAPLTKLTSTKETFIWTPDCEKAFKEMKALAATDAIQYYPDHNLPFVVETDASDYQLGAVIKQNNRPVAYFSRKLNSAQRNYTTIEKELLSVVETFREFRDILLGARITVYTDHKNLTGTLTQYQTQRVARWRLLLEEFGPQLLYKKGEQNVVADALSRVPCRSTTENASSLKRESTDLRQNKSSSNTNVRDDTQEQKKISVDYCPRNRQVTNTTTNSTDSNETSAESYNHDVCENGKVARTHDCRNSIVIDDEALVDCLMMYPRFDTKGRLPFHFKTIAQYQDEDQNLTANVQQYPAMYKKDKLGNHDLIWIKSHENKDWRIAIADAMLKPLIKWFHLSTMHAMGSTRLLNTIARNFYHPKLAEEVTKYITSCAICQKDKTTSKEYGHLAPRDAETMPWEEVHLDSIGEWKITIGSVKISVAALTMIDPVTNILEIARYPESKINGTNCKDLFENTWLSRYPRPIRCLYDQGTEFMNNDFQFMLMDAGIKGKNITSKNAQSNAIIESVHRTIGQVMRTYLNAFPPTNQNMVNKAVDKAIALAMHATRCSAHSSLAGMSPGAVAFRRDMHFNIPLIADIMTLSQMRQAQIDKRLILANAKRIRHDYKKEEQILLRNKSLIGNKLRHIYDGPFQITQVHTNGTVTIRRRAGIHERVNIRRIKPFKIPLGEGE